MSFLSDSAREDSDFAKTLLLRFIFLILMQATLFHFFDSKEQLSREQNFWELCRHQCSVGFSAITIVN